MRRFIVLVAASLALGGALDGATVAAASPGGAVGRSVGAAAKSCPAGFTHAVIGGEQKCLHAGEYCAHAEARQYVRYHFVCDRVRGTYRLERS
jgi:NADPH-dependent curcumin reductase CurA